MRIAFIASEYVSESFFAGGLANYLCRAAQGMKQRGHHVEIFTCSEHNETISHNGIIVNRVKVSSRILKLGNRLMRYRFRKTLNVLSQSHCLKKSFLKRHRLQRFDIVQACSCQACGLFFTFNRRVPVISRISSFVPLRREFYRDRLTRDQRLIEWLELLALSRSNAVYAPSKLLSHILRQEAAIKTDVLRPPFSIDTNVFDESIYNKHLGGKKYFVFVGTIGLLKGGEVLAKVLPNILSQYPEMYFVLIGKDFPSSNGPSMLTYILQQAGAYKKQIIHLGVLRHSQLYPIVKYSQAVVLPSLIDNLPNTMLEAMALGKVVIGTRGTSFEELIDDGVSGVLVEPDNHLELSQAMQRVWDMGDKERGNIGKVAQQRVACLSPEETCIDLEQYFQKFLNQRRQ